MAIGRITWMVLFSTLVVSARSASAAPTYTMTVIPALPGSLAVQGQSINASGAVVGRIYDASMQSNAFVFSNGTTSLIPGVSGSGARSAAMDINDMGEAVGWSQNLSTGVVDGFVYSSGSGLQTLGTLGGPEAVAMGINNGGQIIGYSDTTPLYTGPYAAFSYSNGSIGKLALSTDGVTHSFAYGINGAGQVVGTLYTGDPYNSRAFLHSNGTTTLLSGLESINSSAVAISNSGFVVGGFSRADGTSGSYIYDGGMTDLGYISGVANLGYGLGTHAYTGASSVNSDGLVVGTFGYSGYQGRGYVYEGGAMHDLNSLIVDLGSWEITDAVDINDAGQILAYGYQKGTYIGMALILTPEAVASVPEPSTYALAALALLVACGRVPRIQSRTESC